MFLGINGWPLAAWRQFIVNSQSTMAEGWMCKIVLVVGVVTILYWLLSFIWGSLHLLRCYVRTRQVTGESWTTRFGQWAVVTGASDGIGKTYVHKLAARGMNIVLIARNKDKLDTVAQHVRTEFGIETSVVVADFGDGQSIYDHIAQELEGKDIGVLVNNVGVIGQFNCLFSEWEDKPLWDILNVNIANVPAMTKIVLPGMLQRQRGVIINIGSVASVMPLPSMTMYSASKAFVDFFTQALSIECEGTGVLVQGVHPGYVQSNMTQPFIDYPDILKLPSFMFPTADVFVESALSTVGHTDYTHGYWSHSLQRGILKIMMALPFKAGPRLILKHFMSLREKMRKAM